MPFTIVCVCHTHIDFQRELSKKKSFQPFFLHSTMMRNFLENFLTRPKKKKNLCKFFILHAWSPFIQPNQNQTNRFPFTYFCCCCCFEFCQNRQKKTYLLISTRSRIEGVIIYSKLENKKIPENEMCSSSFFIMKIKNLCRESFFFWHKAAFANEKMKWKWYDGWWLMADDGWWWWKFNQN